MLFLHGFFSGMTCFSISQGFWAWMSATTPAPVLWAVLVPTVVPLVTSWYFSVQFLYAVADMHDQDADRA